MGLIYNIVSLLGCGAEDVESQKCSLAPLIYLTHNNTSDSNGKESSCNAGDLGSVPGLERSPEGGHGSPLQYSCLENPHGQRSLSGYSPWSQKESGVTKHKQDATVLQLTVPSACGVPRTVSQTSKHQNQHLNGGFFQP